MFYVGQKVAVIYDGPSFTGRKSRLRVGQVYTVAGFSDEAGLSYDGDILPRGLLLVEVDARRSCGFDPKRFRPVVDRKTDISIFKAMLNPADKRVEA